MIDAPPRKVVRRRPLTRLDMSFGVAAATADLPVLGGGDPIRDMPTMVGYPTFIAEHILFGLVIGLLLIPVARKSLAHR